MSDSFIIDAQSLTEFQACRRRYLLASDWRPIHWRPKSLFDACLRRGILSLSSGVDPSKVVGEARAQFMQVAANPGLDAQGDTYTLAKDYCAMLSTVLLSVAKLTLLTLHPIKSFMLTTQNGGIEWRPTAHRDDSGALHRWITVDRWDADELSRAMHGWHVIGDIATLRVPMTLHVIEIGQVRNGRRAIAWARGFKRPEMPNLRMRFKRTDGQDFTGWKPFYLADAPGGDDTVAAWVEQMWREGAAEPLMRHVTVDCPADSTCENIVSQMLQEAVRMREMWLEREIIPWSSRPMSRPACDQFVPCPFQSVCYSERVVEVESLSLYQRREVKKVCQMTAQPPLSSSRSLTISA